MTAAPSKRSPWRFSGTDGLLTRRRDGPKNPDATTYGAAAPVAAASGASLSDAAASKVRVLQRKDGYVEVRDEQGNQGWVAAESVR